MKKAIIAAAGKTSEAATAQANTISQIQNQMNEIMRLLQEIRRLEF